MQHQFFSVKDFKFINKFGLTDLKILLKILLILWMLQKMNEIQENFYYNPP
jgi:hypothetical protein